MTTLTNARIDRRGARVDLRGDPNLLSRLASLLEPFASLDVEPEGSASDTLAPVPSGRWLIVAGMEHTAELEASFMPVRLAQSGEPDTHLWISAAQRIVVVDQPPGRWRETMVRRLVHNLLRAQLASAGLLFLHGALCELNGRGIVILGGKQAGKTTTLLSLLTAEGSSFCTNDDATLCAESDRLVGLGWPRSVGIRADSGVQLRRQLGLDFSRIDPEHPITEPQIAAGERPSQARSYYLPREIALTAGRPLRAEVMISLVVLPGFADAASVRALDVDERRACLREHIQDYPDEKQAPFLRALFPSLDFAARDALLERLLTTVPFMKLCQSFDDLVRGRDLILERLGQLSE